jgi:hypothetical protein
LRDQVTLSYAKLRQELDAAGPRVGTLPCVDDWRVKDLLAVRVWWSERVVDWIEAGRRGESPVTPSDRFKWNETPTLNAEVVRSARRDAYRSLRARLDSAHERVVHTIDSLTDRELLEVGAFSWAGKHSIARWLSINTARQYTTARTMIRRAVGQHASNRRSI